MTDKAEAMEHLRAGETLAYLFVFVVFQVLPVAILGLSIMAWQYYKKRMPVLDVATMEAERARRDERNRLLVKKNLLFFLGVGLIVFSRHYVFPAPGWIVYFSFGVIASAGAFVWQVATKS